MTSARPARRAPGCCMARTYSATSEGAIASGVVGEVLEEPLQVLGLVPADEQGGNVGHRLERQVPEKVSAGLGDERLLHEPEPGQRHLEDPQCRDLVAELRGVAVGEHGAPVVPEDRCRLVRGEWAHDLPEFGGDGVGVVAGGGPAREAGAAPVGGDHRVVLGQLRHDPSPLEPGLRPAVQEQPQGPAAAEHVVDPARGGAGGVVGEAVRCRHPAPPKISSATACQAGSLVSISVGLPSHHWKVCVRTVIFQPSSVRRNWFSYQPYWVYWSWPWLFGLRCRETW
jgi:hypothetical protein